jgi:hypothetical protein
MAFKVAYDINTAMREFIVEDGLVRPFGWRTAMLKRACHPESMITALHPAETGLEHTIYASETSDIPAVIIDARTGKQFAPDEQALVLAFGEKSGDPKIDNWLAVHTSDLQAYCDGRFDSIDFYAALRAARRTDEMFRLDEMANFRITASVISS